LSRPLRIATRGSALALAQSRWVADQLASRCPDLRIELSVVRTTGDRVQDVALHQVGGKGLFTKEIEEALLRDEADIAVHSLKDVPGDLPDGLILGACTQSEDPRDALIAREGRGLGDLPSGARVGTSSLRRIAQLRAYRPDLAFESLRGNIDTRLRKLDEEGWEAVVLAGAGLTRLGLADRITEWIDTRVCLPAAGQGILAIETRAGDEATLGLVRSLNHAESQVRAEMERIAMNLLGGGCRTPMGFLAGVAGGACWIEGVWADPTGGPLYRAREAGDTAAASEVAARLAQSLRSMGAVDQGTG
jgi:hydroxymethylbilane synthase